MNRVTAAVALSFWTMAACGGPSADGTRPASPTAPQFELAARPISDHRVEFRVDTNLPPPVTVMADLSLAGQKPDDVWIGYQEKVRLTGPSTTFVLDTAKSDKPLPNATYEATVSFYPLWGAEGNDAAKVFPDLEDIVEVDLLASGQSREGAVRKEELQKWVMLNINMNSPWDEGSYVSRLGHYRKSAATLSRLHDAYYFPAADMTLIVNRVRNEVTLWRVGRATE